MTATTVDRLAEVSVAVASTSKRTEKRSLLAELLAALAPDEMAPAVGMLVGEPRQGRIGIGWATVRDARAASTAHPAGPDTPPDPPLTVAELDAALTELAALSGPGSQTARIERLAELLGRTSDAGADFVGQVLTGGLRQGALVGVMADAVAAAAGVPATVVRRAAMLAGDWPEVAELALTEGRAGLEAVGLTVGRGLLPMLAGTSASAGEAVAELGPSSVEWKLDGIRLQAHRLAGGEVRLYSRNLNDLTGRLPGVAAVVAGLEATSFVLDGEVLGWIDDDRPAAFADTMSGTAASRPGDGLRPYFFDVLHLDGVDLIDEPLSQRSDRLAALVPPELRIPSTATDDPAIADRVFDEAVAAGHEGVVVKQLDTPYQAGRRGKGWRKVKPVHTLDLVVLAAEWGHGRRTGRLSNLWLGARDPDGGFVMVGKTFKGLTDELLAWQTDALLARQTRRDGIVVHVRPELVVEIALDGIQTSTRYPGGVALRFARVVGYRSDKAPAAADTIDAVRALGG